MFGLISKIIFKKFDRIGLIGIKNAIPFETFKNQAQNSDSHCVSECILIDTIHLTKISAVSTITTNFVIIAWN